MRFERLFQKDLVGLVAQPANLVLDAVLLGEVAELLLERAVADDGELQLALAAGSHAGEGLEAVAQALLLAEARGHQDLDRPVGGGAGLEGDVAHVHAQVVHAGLLGRAADLDELLAQAGPLGEEQVAVLEEPLEARHPLLLEGQLAHVVAVEGGHHRDVVLHGRAEHQHAAIAEVRMDQLRVVALDHATVAARPVGVGQPAVHLVDEVERAGELALVGRVEVRQRKVRRVRSLVADHQREKAAGLADLLVDPVLRQGQILPHRMHDHRTQHARLNARVGGDERGRDTLVTHRAS
ncbi:hypothetical protein D3C72_692470 [compost metagenome]